MGEMDTGVSSTPPRVRIPVVRSSAQCVTDPFRFGKAAPVGRTVRPELAHSGFDGCSACLDGSERLEDLGALAEGT